MKRRYERPKFDSRTHAAPSDRVTNGNRCLELWRKLVERAFPTGIQPGTKWRTESRCMKGEGLDLKPHGGFNLAARGFTVTQIHWCCVDNTQDIQAVECIIAVFVHFFTAVVRSSSQDVRNTRSGSTRPSRTALEIQSGLKFQQKKESNKTKEQIRPIWLNVNHFSSW